MGDARPSVVIVGAGLMGRWHLDAARHAGARIAAVVDRNPERAVAVGGRALARPTLADALRRDVSVVHVCTPAGTHLPLCLEALASGCHVIVEKPATLTGEEAIALDTQARASGRMVVPVHQFVFQEGIRNIRSQLPAFGNIRQLEFATASAGGDRDGADPDVVAAEILPHPLSLARHLLGVDMAPLAWEFHRPSAGEWRLSAVTRTGCQITAMISMRARPTFASCRVLGESGSASADLFHGFAVFEAGRTSRRYKVVRPLVLGARTLGTALWNLAGRGIRRESAYPGLRRLCAASYRAVAGGPPPFRDGEMVDVAGARDQVLALAATASGANQLPA